VYTSKIVVWYLGQRVGKRSSVDGLKRSAAFMPTYCRAV
jgi:hypothetical protein